MNRIDPKTIPFDVAILPMCRCQDCRKWLPTVGCLQTGHHACSPSQPAPQPGQVQVDIGTINPADWLYCLFYRGPKVSEKFLVLPRQQGQA